MPETYEEMAVYVAIAAVAAVVYWKDKSTSVDLKKIDLTPQQEYNIKQVVEWILKLLGYDVTVEKKPEEECDPEPSFPDIPDTEFLTLVKAELERRGLSSG